MLDNIKEEEKIQVFPTCGCGWQNTNFPGVNKEVVCTPCQLKEESDHESFINHGI